MKLPNDLKTKIIASLAEREEGSFTYEKSKSLAMDIIEQVGCEIMDILNEKDISRVGLTGLALISIGLDVCAEKKVDKKIIEMLAELYYKAEEKKAN